MPSEPTPLERLLDAVDGCDGVIVDRAYLRFFVWRGSVVQAYDARTGEAWDAPWPLNLAAVALRGRAAVEEAVRERMNQGY